MGASDGNALGWPAEQPLVSQCRDVLKALNDVAVVIFVGRPAVGASAQFAGAIVTAPAGGALVVVADGLRSAGWRCWGKKRLDDVRHFTQRDHLFPPLRVSDVGGKGMLHCILQKMNRRCSPKMGCSADGRVIAVHCRAWGNGRSR